MMSMKKRSVKWKPKYNAYYSGKASVEAADSIFPATSFHLNLTKQLQQLSAWRIACGFFQHGNCLHPYQATNTNLLFTPSNNYYLDSFYTRVQLSLQAKMDTKQLRNENAIWNIFTHACCHTTQWDNSLFQHEWYNAPTLNCLSPSSTDRTVLYTYLVIVLEEGMNKRLLQSRHTMSIINTKLRQLTYTEHCQIKITQPAYNVSLCMHKHFTTKVLSEEGTYKT